MAEKETGYVDLPNSWSGGSLNTQRRMFKELYDDQGNLIKNNKELEKKVNGANDKSDVALENSKISKETIDEIKTIADESEKKSSKAENTANQSNSIAKDTNDRLNLVIADGGDSVAEIVESRKPFGEESFPTLGERLNANDKTVDSKNNNSDLTINSFSKSVSSNLKLVEIKNEELRIFTRTQSKDEYVMFRLRKGFGDTSAASYGQNFDLLRLDNVHSYKDVIGFYQPEDFLCSKIKDGSSDDFKFANFSTGYSTPEKMNYISNSGREAQASYLEFEVEITRANNGRLDLGFYGTPNTNKNLNILINGKFVDNVDTSSEIAKTVFRSVNVGSVIGKATIRLQVADDTTANRAVHFLGYNASDLKYVTSKSRVNGYLANLNNGKHYISKTSGANDYAILDNSNKKWFGSFHGGEKLLSRLILVDGVEIDLTKNVITEANNVSIIQVTDLIDKVESQTITDFSEDGTFMFVAHFEVKSSVNVSDVYTCMTCSNNEFREVIYPKMVTAGNPNNTVYLEKTGRVIQMNPTTNQKITTEYIPQLKYYTTNALRVLYFDNLYSKVYHAQTVNNPIKLENIDFGNRKIFD